MDNLGLNNDILVSDRKFHIQTNYSETKQQISSKVFNEGEVVDSRDVDIAVELTIEEARRRLEEVHQQVITEMEVLYYINEKVKTVRHAPSANKLGLLFLEKKLHKEARNQFNLALEIDPDFSEVYANLGKTCLIEDDYDQAIAVLEKGVKQAPNYADIHNYLGVAYLYKENYPAAIKHLERAIELNKNYLGARYHLGMAQLASLTDSADRELNPDDQHLRDALSTLKTASEKATNTDIPNSDKAMQFVDDQAYKQAVDEFLLSKPKETIKHFSDIENEFYLKFMYGGKGKDDGFISEYVEKLKDILEEHPEYADVRNNLGVANLIQCRNLFLKSLEEFRSALKLNPKFKRAEKNLKLAENDGKGFLILLRAILK